MSQFLYLPLMAQKQVCIYCMYESGHIFCELNIINFKLGLNVPTFFTQQNKSVTSAPIPKEHTYILWIFYICYSNM